jgi:hypothetical protein
MAADPWEIDRLDLAEPGREAVDERLANEVQ